MITISKVLFDEGADINKTTCSGVTVFQSASQYNNERF